MVRRFTHLPRPPSPAPGSMWANQAIGPKCPIPIIRKMEEPMSEKCPCCHVTDPDPKGYRKAINAATVALRRMKTKGWKIRICHNMHWYWSLQNSHLSVSPDGNGMFCGFMSDKQGGISTLAVWHTQRYFKDPNRAAEHALKCAEAYTASLVLAVTTQRQALSGQVGE